MTHTDATFDAHRATCHSVGEPVMTNPRAVRNTLSYVLNNWRRHREDRASFAANWKVDPFSSGLYFADWAELGDSPSAYRPRAGYFGLMTWLPKTWLLRVGWKLSGTVSNREIPGRPTF